MGLGFLDFFNNEDKPVAKIGPTKAEIDYQNAMKDIKARETADTMGFANRVGKPISTAKNSITNKTIGNTVSQPINNNQTKKITNKFDNPVVKNKYNNINNKSKDDLLTKAYENDKYNRDNKYRTSGLNLSNRTGDFIGDVVNRLFGF